ncbi:unnamed protein product [Paramecium octaurelia]|uniref:Uncharacterized protein n=1 Tax=Paramecium octaurelia TaxID=43137 RepID=A0A8S1YNH8_PAROT|nr:unnamed protein product [Paramecium octaurelia]
MQLIQYQAKNKIAHSKIGSFCFHKQLTQYFIIESSIQRSQFLKAFQQELFWNYEGKQMAVRLLIFLAIIQNYEALVIFRDSCYSSFQIPFLHAHQTKKIMAQKKNLLKQIINKLIQYNNNLWKDISFVLFQRDCRSHRHQRNSQIQSRSDEMSKFERIILLNIVNFTYHNSIHLHFLTNTFYLKELNSLIQLKLSGFGCMIESQQDCLKQICSTSNCGFVPSE